MIKNYFFLGVILMCVNSFAQNGSVAGSVLVNIDDNISAICGSGGCTDLMAHYPEIKATTSYTVTPSIYQPLFPFVGGIIIPPSDDDKWSPLVALPFNFCFYGNVYNQVLVGTNGVITFDTTNNVANGNCPWSFATTIPNSAFPIKNAIYGVYQDTDIRIPPVTNYAIQNVNYYVTGIAPNRSFVANFNELPVYQCNGDVGLQTTQIILMETSNIIEIYVKNRTACNSWQNGVGVLGLQNQSGTMATVPEGRNTGNWSAVNEAYRFTPNGESVTAFSWSKNGVYFGNSNPINVCPDDGDTFTATVNYTNCDGIITTLTDERVLHYSPLNVGETFDLTACSENSTTTFDLTQEEAAVFAGLNLSDYEHRYYTDPLEAEYATETDIPYGQLTNYTGTNGQIIYMRIEDLVNGTGCHLVKPFTLTINTPPGPPTGDSEQSFTPGQTLADIEVEGLNVNWYGEAIGGEPLPMDTALVSGTTYYATQTNTTTGCESTSRNALSNRLAVTVFDNLSTGNWSITNLKLHPNPTKDIVNLSAQQSITAVTVFNLLGQQMISFPLNANDVSINISQLAAGTYMMRITAGNQIKTVKVIKE
ncbi:MAG: T9SS type A sorting domain-containing protein [Flavobacterium sp.]|nr:T9SS type A sorting domain-containing protein [Flavobacterium sp.]